MLHEQVEDKQQENESAEATTQRIFGGASGNRRPGRAAGGAVRGGVSRYAGFAIG
jgi:hypothetical protein